MDEFDVAVEHEDRKARGRQKLKRGALASASVGLLALLFAAPSCLKDTMELLGAGTGGAPKQAMQMNPLVSQANRNTVSISWLDLGSTKDFVASQLGAPMFERRLVKSGSEGLAGDYTYALYDFPASQLEILFDSQNTARIIVVKKMSQRPVPFHRVPSLFQLGGAALEHELFYVENFKLAESDSELARQKELNSLRRAVDQPEHGVLFKTSWESPYAQGWLEYSNSKWNSFVYSHSLSNAGGYYNCLIASYEDDAQGPDAYAIYDIPGDWIDRKVLWDVMLDMVGQPSDMTRDFLPFE